MATYYTDFSEYSTGVIPSDWSDVWRSGSGYTVETVGGSIYGGQDLQTSITGTAFNRLCSWDDVSAAHADVEILALLMQDGSIPTSSGISIAVVGRGDASDGDGYMAGLDNSADQFQIKHNNSVLGSASWTESSGEYFWVRFRLNSTSLDAKIWVDGDAEPGSWDISITDSTNTAAGYQGFYQRRHGGTKHCDYFAVGTAGDTAPDPPSGDIPNKIYTRNQSIVRASRW